jgi:alkylation response protein AidB-like acyl-CoA dehydrogenase
MDFELPEHTREIKGLVRRLVEQYAMPLEQKFLRGERVTEEDQAGMTAAAKEVGLWGLNLPAEYGGAALSTLDNVVITEENSRCLVPIQFGGNAGFLLACNDEQKERYLYPVLRGEKRYAFAQTEPSGGSDPGGMMETVAVRDGDNWVINGSKIFITRAGEADFTIVMAVTDNQKRQHGGVTAFLVDRDTPGFRLIRQIPVMRAGGQDGFLGPWELHFEDCVVPASQVLGQVGIGFRLAQAGLSTARMNIGAQCVGIADRCLEMMIGYAKQRMLFGEPLAAKQSIQSMIVDSAVEVQSTRLLTYDAAWKNDQGKDTRVEAGMMKLLASEMVGRVVDRAIQIHGAYGVTTELPFSHWYTRVRMMRIYEGASEVQKYQVVARALLQR